MLRERRWTCASFCGDAGVRNPRECLAGRGGQGFPLADKFRPPLRPSRAKPSGKFQRSASPRGQTRWVCLGWVSACRKGRRAATTRAGGLETIRHSGGRGQYAQGHSIVIRPRQVSLGRNLKRRYLPHSRKQGTSLPWLGWLIG